MGASILEGTEVSVGNTATLLLAADGDRSHAIIRNIGDDVGQVVFIGGSAVATTDGMPLENGTEAGKRGDSITIPGTAAIYGIVASGTQVVRVLAVGD